MSAELILSDPVAADFPHAQIWLVRAEGLRNQGPWPEVDHRIATLEAELADGGYVPVGEDDPRIESWFAAYRQFGTNPKRFRPSVNALSRRLAKSGRLPRISPAVDAYNLVSVRHGLPAGAFDCATLHGTVEIRYARSGDTFTPLSEPETTEQPRPGEVVYARANMVLTRHWNHRDADQTKVTEQTTDVVFLIERVADVVDEATLVAAATQLADLLRPHATQITTARLCREERRTALPASSAADS
jgi:DNA/RNA-binding domain of Phe-tRNA-synthetase-like protein